jgi:hypothetical protein
MQPQQARNHSYSSRAMYATEEQLMSLSLCAHVYQALIERVGSYAEGEFEGHWLNTVFRSE